MSNGFPYWQFHCDRWLTGKINAFELDEQGLFLHLCMKAWVGKGPFNICSTLVQREFNKSEEWFNATLKAFLDCGIICKDGDNYRIKFIDDQLVELGTVRAKRSQAGKASAAARSLTLQKEEEKKSIEEKRRVACSTHVDTCSTHVDKNNVPFNSSDYDFNTTAGIVAAVRACRKEYALTNEGSIINCCRKWGVNKSMLAFLVQQWCEEQAASLEPNTNPISYLNNYLAKRYDSNDTKKQMANIDRARRTV